MRKIVAILMIVLSEVSYGDLQQCSVSVMNNRTTKQAVDLLQSVQGQYKLGQCQIQLTVCSSQPSPMPGDDMVVGDLSVTDRYGQQFYLALDMNQADTSRVKKLILNGPRMVHYEDIEHLYGPTTGRSENYWLEIVKTTDLKQIESLDLGIYTSTLRSEYPYLKPGTAYWVDCSTK